MRSFSVRHLVSFLSRQPLQSHALVPFRPTSSSSTPPVTRPFTFSSHIILVSPSSHTPLCLSVPPHPRQPIQSHALLPFHFTQHFVPPLRFFSPCPRHPGKVPGISAKTVHFPPWLAGAPAPQASLAAPAIPSPPGKCRDFPQKRFTFPRGRPGHRLQRPISLHSSFPPPGKVPGIPAKTVHFPPWPAGAPAPQPSLAAPAISASGESAGNSCENGSLSPVACRGTGSTAISGGTRHSLPPGKVPGFPAKTVHFPSRHETSGEVQQGLLGKVPSIQAL